MVDSKKMDGVLILLLLFVPPIGIYKMIREKRWGTSIRILVILIYVFLIIATFWTKK